LDFLGFHDEIDRELMKNSRHWTTSVESVLGMVQVEIDRRNADVGPPIDAVVVTRDAIRWISLKAQCAP
jgi:hypothetical protein